MDVIETLKALGGQGHYVDIYAQAKIIREARKSNWPRNADAIIRRVLEEQSSDSLSFKGKSDLFYSVDGIGQGVWGLRPSQKSTEQPDFQIGELYSRKLDINGRFGGSYQGGMAPSNSHPCIFLFTGDAGEAFGYSDGWDEEGIFNYTGQGKNGDMSFDNSNNRAVRDHIIDGRDIYLFQQRGKRELYRFLGQFVCVGYEIKKIPDEQNTIRNGIIFQLKNVDEELETVRNLNLQIPKNDLRKRAYQAASKAKHGSSREGKTTYYERNETIKLYVLDRSNGFCECCGNPAPFYKKDGSPYLEPHHIYKLSDKGMDHPKMVAAITPNCHREIHFGQNGHLIDQRLEKIIAKKEADIGPISE